MKSYFRKTNFYRWLFFSMAFLTLTKNAQSSEFDTENLQISHLLLRNSKTKMGIETSEAIWQKSCKNLGDFLKLSGGFYETGMFLNFECGKRSLNISSNEQKELFIKKLSPGWHLIVIEYEDRSEIGVFYKKNDRLQKEAGIILNTNGYLIEMLNLENYARLLAFNLIAQLPYAYRISNEAPPGQLSINHKKHLKNDAQSSYVSSELEKTNNEIAKKFLEDIPPAPELLFYSLRFNKKYRTWESNSLRIAKAETIVEEPDTTKYKSIKPDKAKLIFAHSAEYRSNAFHKSKTLIETFSKRLHKDTSSYYDNFFNQTFMLLAQNISKGYFGLRYGPQILAGNTLLEESSLFSLISEFRGGFLSGVKLYYDKVPEAEISSGAEVETLSWSRILVGYSLGFNFKSFIDRIDFVPKIGSWTYNADLLIYAEDIDDFESKNFSLNNELTIGGEVGVEWQSSMFLFRLWTAIDQAFPSKKSTHSITTRRYGSDLWLIDGPQLTKTFNTSFLLFALFEQVEIARNETNLDVEDEKIIDYINMFTGYVGLGVAISW
ncbi:MAG: hypothetical protein KBD78_03150 [Oligoflexales bacterium]|nr:hypothetical protein [Oligoflexales bacterium]